MDIEQRLHNRPPVINTDLTPVIICGDDLDMLEIHFEAVMRVVTVEDMDRAMKACKFTPSDRKRCAELYLECRNAGYFPAYIRNKRIVWGQMKASDVQIEMGLTHTPADKIMGDKND